MSCEGVFREKQKPGSYTLITDTKTLWFSLRRSEISIAQEVMTPGRRSEERSASWRLNLSLTSAPPNGVDANSEFRSINIPLLRSEKRPWQTGESVLLQLPLDVGHAGTMLWLHR